MVAGTQMAEVAALVGDPGRASMLAILMDGRAHAAGELAAAAGVSSATASGHLGKLLRGRLTEVTAQGRHRYYRLASPEVARMLEGIMVVTADPTPRRRATPRIPAELREARTCYDHLAGRLGVAITDTLVRGGVLRLDGDSAELTGAGETSLATLGIRPLDIRAGRRVLCRPCLDWSERRPHLAGALGKALLERFLELGWVERHSDTRALRVTPIGSDELRHRFGYERLT